MTDKPPPEPGTVLEFLEALYPGVPWSLNAIDPDNGHITTTAITSPRQVERWLDANNGSRNLYYSVNVTRDPAVRAKKQDVIAVHFIHADLDPRDGESPEDAKRRYLARISKRVALAELPEPSALVNSGNGLQPLWQLAKGLKAPARKEEIERINKAVTLALGGKPGTQDISRILRLPFTTNLPTKAKRAKGRVKCEATLLSYSGKRYTLADFARYLKGEGKRTKREEAHPHADNDGNEAAHLLDQLSQSLRHAILTGDLVGYPSRSEAAAAIISEMRRRKFTDAEMQLLYEIYAAQGVFCHYESAKEFCADVDRLDDKRAEAKQGGGDGGKAAGGRRIIRFAAGEITTSVDLAEDALIDRDLPIFTRGRALVEPIVNNNELAANGRLTSAVYFGDIGRHRLIDLLGRAAVFQRWDKRSQDWLDINPPPQVADILLTREAEWRLRPVSGIITIPTLRSDGTLISQAGYDEATGLYLHPDPRVTLPPVTAVPSEKQARAALALLEELLEEFPFADEVSRAVAISQLMTPVVRGAMDVAPLHANSAPANSSGKTYLIDLAAAIVSGDACPVTGSSNREELEKRCHALVLQGAELISIDNVEAPLGGASLCQMIERPKVAVRVLGQSKSVECEARATWFANGINLILEADLVRRSLICTLDPKTERPELRKFTNDPFKVILADRGKYIAAIITVARYKSKDRLDLPPLASFAAWARWVREPLVGLGLEDPVKSQEHLRAADPELQAIRQLFEFLKVDRSTDKAFSASELIGKACGRHNDPDLGDVLRVYDQRLYELLLTATKEKNTLSPNKVGTWLAHISGRVVSDHVLQVISSVKYGNCYRLTSAEAHARSTEADPEGHYY